MAYETCRTTTEETEIDVNFVILIGIGCLVTDLVRCRLPSCTAISELLNSFNSFRIAALSLGVSLVHGLSARRS